MKNLRKILSVLMILALTATFILPKFAYAAEGESVSGSETSSEQETAPKPKYVSEVFFANGRTEEEAKSWLISHGYEPLSGNSNVNAGKDSTWDKSMAVVMGIKRTDNKEDAITDMAVMNMTGGYSEPDYQSLITAKQGEIDAFLDTLMPVLEEFRANYNGQGSSFGKMRADTAYMVLNRFIDGEADDPYRKSDTLKPLGELLTKQTRREVGEDAYKASPESCADLQQIILEASGPVVTVIEQMLFLAADASEDTWLERLSQLAGENLSKNLARYVPEAAGQDVAASAAINFLRQHFGDAARIIASQYETIQEEMLWYEDYNNKYDLWHFDEETDDEYKSRLDAYFEALKKKDEKEYDDVNDRYSKAALLYAGLYESPYKGEWGDTLGDFFNPVDGVNYGLNSDNFLVFAAAMSKGQRAALGMVSLSALLEVGFADEEGYKKILPQVEDIFGDAPQISVYAGVNRAIFRGGVALTSQALMDEKSGLGQAYEELHNHLGLYSVAAYAAAALGLVTFVTGAIMKSKGSYEIFTGSISDGIWLKDEISAAKRALARYEDMQKAGYQGSKGFQADMAQYKVNLEKYTKEYNSQVKTGYTRIGNTGRVLMAIGGVMMIAAAVVKGVELYRYYQRTFTPIPLMIVDEADIVSYTKDENGNEIRNINFDQYVYYEAARCNRQEVGEISDWQDGVDQYQEWGCGDIADLNGDFGQEWLVLYTVKSEKKGNPILADSLTLQYGSSAKPTADSKPLHLFTYTSAVDLGDTGWSFSNKMNGVYLFWEEEKAENGLTGTTPGNSTETAASAFTKGQMGLAAAAGLVVGIGTASLLLIPRRKKKEENEA